MCDLGGQELFGDSNSVQTALRGVDQIYSTPCAFAAVLTNGTVLTWVDKDYGCVLGPCRRS